MTDIRCLDENCEGFVSEARLGTTAFCDACDDALQAHLDDEGYQELEARTVTNFDPMVHYLEGLGADEEEQPPEGATLVERGFAVGPTTPTTHNGERYLIRTCYEFEAGRWEGFVSMRPEGSK